MEPEPEERDAAVCWALCWVLGFAVSLNPLITQEAGSSLPAVSRGEGSRLREEDPLLQVHSL